MCGRWEKKNRKTSLSLSPPTLLLLKSREGGRKGGRRKEEGVREGGRARLRALFYLFPLSIHFLEKEKEGRGKGKGGR